MAVLRMQSPKLLFILFVVGFNTNDVNGAPLDCTRPVFTNPYAITIEPDQQAYGLYEKILPNCEEGHTSSSLPRDFIFCLRDGTWHRDISGGRCYAQCNTTKVISDDDIKVTDDIGKQQTVFNHGEVAIFECTTKSQITGSDQGTCDNGTLKVKYEPSCLAYCPVYLEELGVGLYQDTAYSPVINETNTLYYGDGYAITYRCSWRYEGPTKRTSSDDGTSTCNNGSWDPPGIPTCVGHWKVVVGVTVPIISILTITIVGLTCWQYRRLHRTSPTSAKTKMRTFPYDDDTRGSSDREAVKPESRMFMNNDGTVQEVVLTWRNIPAEEEIIFAPYNVKGRTQMLPTVDYPSDFAGSASYDDDPLGNIVDSYDHYNIKQPHDMTNSTEIDSKYF